MISSWLAMWLVALPAPLSGDSIDSIIDRSHAQAGITPAAACSDDQFLRRVTLDLAGRIPTMAELEQFRSDPDRAAKIDQLLASSDYPRFMAEIWTAALVGYLNVFGTDREALRIWLEQEFREDTPYDQIVTALITAEGTSSLDGPVNFLVRNRDDPVVKVGRLFLGVRLDCAQCHDHPFDRWTQDDYRNMQRFFGQVANRQTDGSYHVHDEIRTTGPGQRPVFLTGARPQTDYWRAELALFVTHSKPFARTFGNRVWYHLMGQGIVDPVDDFNAANPPAVPELVEFLAEQARANQFSLQEMMRLICNSRAYQRDSQGTDAGPQAERSLARRSLKPLTPGQYYDSVAIALDLPASDARRQQFIRVMVGDALQEDFNLTWEYRETVQKAMARLAMQIRPGEMGIPEMYRRILTREPGERELQICQDRPPADVQFALLHSNEFFFNH